MTVQSDTLIYNEMMSHPILFAHPDPKKIVIIGDKNEGILREVLKHPAVTDVLYIHQEKNTVSDSRIHYMPFDKAAVLVLPPDAYDVIIHADSVVTNQIDTFYHALSETGMLVQQSHAPFEIASLKTLQQKLFAAKFSDAQAMHFPQVSSSPSWCCAVLAKKEHHFRRLREKDIFNKPFATHYYNLDVHKASLAIPEFMREELEAIL